MESKPIHSLIKQKQENLEKKWKTLIEYSDDKILPIPALYQQDAIHLFENIEQMIKSYRKNNPGTPDLLLREVLPFFRINYMDFLKEEIKTIDILPLYACNKIYSQLKISTVVDESSIVSYPHDCDNEVALMKVNDRHYLFLT